MWDAGRGTWDVGGQLHRKVAHCSQYGSTLNLRAWILITNGEEAFPIFIFVSPTMSATNGTDRFSKQGSQPSRLLNGDCIQVNKLSTQHPDRMLHEISDVDLASSVSQEQAVGEIIEGIKLAGACIVRNMVSKNALDEIERDIRPHLDTASVWKGMFSPVCQA